MTATVPVDHDNAVRARYSAGARAQEPALCCPISYDSRYLGVIPDEVLKKDYGCGDPSRYAVEGDVVLDLGSGGGKACFIASQIVGAAGSVIGVDANPDMLSLARQHAPTVAERVGWSNVQFRRGRIEDLALDLDLLAAWLAKHPVQTPEDLARLETEMARLRRDHPLVADCSVDLVMSNCVLNLLREDRKAPLLDEIFRVLKPGGRAVISDIVSDEPVPLHLKQDPDLWSGCISGALPEQDFVTAFERAGFLGIEILGRSDAPWQTIEGIEFRSLTVRAYRGDAGACLDSNKAIVYRGPWKRVHDDDGHVFRRGVREAVCEKTFQQMTRPPYEGHFDAILPLVERNEAEWPAFDCARTAPRTPQESKGAGYSATTEACSDGGCC